MIDEQLEFLIAQYADGTLPESERAAVELRLRTDAVARALLDEYRALDASLKSAMPLPAVNWDRLANHLSEAVDVERDARAATVLGRIGHWGRLAVAACVVLASGLVIWMQTESRDGTQIGNGTVTVGATQPVPAPTKSTVIAALPKPSAAAPVVVVRGPSPEASSSNPVAVVSVGPSANVAEDWRAAEGVVITGPSRAVWIASGYEPAQDTQRLPY